MTTKIPLPSFLGIPIELRLQIYTYLLDTGISNSDSTTNQDYDKQQPAKGYPNFCTSSHALSTQILRVSKQTLYEARPILYSVNPIIVQIPYHDSPDSPRITEYVLKREFRLPTLLHITYLCLPGYLGEFSCSRHWHHSSLGFTKQDWTCLATYVPYLRRLALGTRVAMGDVEHCDDVVWAELGRAFSRLEDVELYFLPDPRWQLEALKMLKFAAALKRTIRTAGEEVGKEIAVRLSKHSVERICGFVVRE